VLHGHTAAYVKSSMSVVIYVTEVRSRALSPVTRYTMFYSHIFNYLEMKMMSGTLGACSYSLHGLFQFVLEFE